MEGCSAPLVVKFADTQKEKDQKKIQQMQASIVGITALTSPTTGAIAGLASAHPNGFLPTTAAALVPNPISVTNARTNCSMPLSMATVAVANPASALVPSSAAISVPPSLLTTDSRQQTSPYLTTAEAMNVSPAQLHIFQQLQAFGLHPTQYLQEFASAITTLSAEVKGVRIDLRSSINSNTPSKQLAPCTNTNAASPANSTSALKLRSLPAATAKRTDKSNRQMRQSITGSNANAPGLPAADRNAASSSSS
ncbi:CUGBP Elav-like family member 2 [Rhagoletis pomonella]|uniref:CUGBP Elav-like family member 2 n=1 Tax=Rhagoletis pomonella TaxID=28610 RepID=UPI00177AE20E|nr:CUGBP Elav-like family member 2 [Rhagoletis pomonella]